MDFNNTDHPTPWQAPMATQHKPEKLVIDDPDGALDLPRQPTSLKKLHLGGLRPSLPLPTSPPPPSSPTSESCIVASSACSPRDPLDPSKGDAGPPTACPPCPTHASLQEHTVQMLADLSTTATQILTRGILCQVFKGSFKACFKENDFNGIWCLETWQQDPVASSCPQITKIIEVTPVVQVEEYTHEHAAFITLLFASKLPANINPPLHRGHDTQENYSFTVKQHALAEDAQTVNSLEELEDVLDEMLAKGYHTNDTFVQLDLDLFLKCKTITFLDVNGIFWLTILLHMLKSLWSALIDCYHSSLPGGHLQGVDTV
ncbi:hypothetical protein F5887DRAFT_1068848 [Amanita rubescens]|nr:hypothetical protein F5887DRAFT_1068848 [Amanita rubescens]